MLLPCGLTDAYGVMLGGNPTSIPANGTSLLYSGEHFDTSMSNYYLRARWYDHNIGRFTSLDPFSGNMQDPQSLHKYLYCHADPVNNADPSGMYEGLVSLSTSMAIWALISGITFSVAGAVLDRAYGVSWGQTIQNALFTFGATVLAVMSVPFMIALLLAVSISLGVKAIDQGLNKEDGVRIATFLLLGILLSAVFKNCFFAARAESSSPAYDVAGTFKNASYREITLQPGTILKRAFERGKSEPVKSYTTRGKTAEMITSTEQAVEQLNLNAAGTKPNYMATLRVTRPVKAWVGKVEGGGQHAFQYWVEDYSALELTGDPIPLPAK